MVLVVDEYRVQSTKSGVLPFRFMFRLSQFEETEYQENENSWNQKPHMTTYLYRPGHPLASKTGFVEKNDFLMHPPYPDRKTNLLPHPIGRFEFGTGSGDYLRDQK
jgi:hypothetical protein